MLCDGAGLHPATASGSISPAPIVGADRRLVPGIAASDQLIILLPYSMNVRMACAASWAADHIACDRLPVDFIEHLIARVRIEAGAGTSRSRRVLVRRPPASPGGRSRPCPPNFRARVYTYGIFYVFYQLLRERRHGRAPPTAVRFSSPFDGMSIALLPGTGQAEGGKVSKIAHWWQSSVHGFSIKRICVATCMAICVAGVAPAAFADNGHGECDDGRCANPAPAPLVGSSLLGLMVLGAGAGAIALHRRARRG